jgi:prevent-host-death family protein
MNQVGAFEAKTHLSRLLKRVSDGEEFTITKHGQPIAKLVPVNRRAEDQVAWAVAGLQALRQKNQATLNEIVSWIREGRN